MRHDHAQRCANSRWRYQILDQTPAPAPATALDTRFCAGSAQPVYRAVTRGQAPALAAAYPAFTRKRTGAHAANVFSRRLGYTHSPSTLAVGPFAEHWLRTRLAVRDQRAVARLCRRHLPGLAPATGRASGRPARKPPHTRHLPRSAIARFQYVIASLFAPQTRMHMAVPLNRTAPDD